jgi:hypothetical protein
MHWACKVSQCLIIFLDIYLSIQHDSCTHEDEMLQLPFDMFKLHLP